MSSLDFDFKTVWCRDCNKKVDVMRPLLQPGIKMEKPKSHSWRWGNHTVDDVDSFFTLCKLSDGGIQGVVFKVQRIGDSDEFEHVCQVEPRTVAGE